MLVAGTRVRGLSVVRIKTELPEQRSELRAGCPPHLADECGPGRPARKGATQAPRHCVIGPRADPCAPAGLSGPGKTSPGGSGKRGVTPHTATPHNLAGEQFPCLTTSSPPGWHYKSQARKPPRSARSTGRAVVLTSALGFGPVLIYCRTPNPVLIHHQAFSQALTAARGLFPPGYGAPLPARSEQPQGHPVIAAITAQDDDACKLTAYTAGAAHDGRPALVITIGALTVNCRDLHAVQDLPDAWNDALTHAPGLWPHTERGQAVGTV